MKAQYYDSDGNRQSITYGQESMVAVPSREDEVFEPFDDGGYMQPVPPTPEVQAKMEEMIKEFFEEYSKIGRKFDSFVRPETPHPYQRTIAPTRLKPISKAIYTLCNSLSASPPSTKERSTTFPDPTDTTTSTEPSTGS